MKDFLVVWTYIANFGKMVVKAESANQAATQVFLGFSEDFRKRGTVYACPINQVVSLGKDQ